MTHTPALARELPLLWLRRTRVPGEATVLKCIVLLAEDFDDTREVFAFYLREAGFAVHDLPDGDHVLPLARGGSNARENLRRAHKECNAARRP